MDFKTLNDIAKSYGEKNDCAVKAISVVLQTSYEDAHTLIKKFGRKDGIGTCFFSTLVPAMAYRGFRLNLVKSRYKTIAEFERRKETGKLRYPLFIKTNRHIVGVNSEGDVIDFTSGRNFKIKEIYEIIPIDDFAVYSQDVEKFEKPNVVEVKTEFKYALVHIETDQVYKQYKRFPHKVSRHIESLYIRTKRAETEGKLMLKTL